MRTCTLRATALGCLIAGLCLAQQPAFDAASVKVLDPAARPSFGNTGGPGTADPGRIHWCCSPLITLLMKAYDIQTDQVSGPSWIFDFMGPNRYLIDATMPPDTTKAQFQSMLQNLLAERFHLAVHHETRNFPGYELVVAKDGPKLKAAVHDPNAPADGAPVKPMFAKDGRFQFPPGPRMGQMEGKGTLRLQAQEEPISALVASLGSMITQALGTDLMTDLSAPKARVTDKTGLAGKYDFTLEFACDGCRGLGAMAANLPIFAGRAQADPPAASEPAGSGLPNIFVAFEKQLGLKLEKVKDVPLDVIVVDRVEKVPTAN
jgi:uncharacterized protein (TIGR03435 family)